MNPPRSVLAVVIPAKNEESRIGATVAAAAAIDGVDLVVAVDDGSTDRTAEVAAGAGAVVVRHARNRGKGAAMETGSDAATRRGADLLLFLDADLSDTADAAAPLIPPVRDGSADMTIALLPAVGSAGGHGLVVGLARRGIVRATGWIPTQPLSGQRCLTASAFAAARPLAHGFGVETGLTIDVLRAGYRVLELPCDLRHRVTGTDVRSQLHRGRQFRDVARALAARGVLPIRFDRASLDAADLARPDG